MAGILAPVVASIVVSGIVSFTPKPVFAQTSCQPGMRCEESEAKTQRRLQGAADAAKSAGTSQVAAQMSSIAMAGALAAQCGRFNRLACTMSALAAQQAMSLGGTSAGAYRSAVFHSAVSSGGRSPSSVGTGNGSVSGVKAQYEKVMSDLSSKGVKLLPDGKTVEMPDGKKYTGSDVGSAAAAQAAGFSKNEIESSFNAIKDIQADAAKNNKKAGILDDAGSSGGGKNGGSGGGRAAYYGAGSNVNFALSQERAKPDLSGMSRNFGGDRIGVSGDDLFEMIKRRYKAKDQADYFFKN